MSAVEACRAMYLLAALPACGVPALLSSLILSGPDPARRRATRIALVAAALAVAAAVALLMAKAHALAAVAPEAAARPMRALAGTRYGQVWIARAALGALGLFLIMLSDGGSRRMLSGTAALTLASGLAVGALAGHAVGLPAGGSWAHALHLIAAAAWSGGLVLLVALPRGSPGPGSVLARFSRVAAPLVAVLAASGAWIADGLLAATAAWGQPWAAPGMLAIPCAWACCAVVLELAWRVFPGSRPRGALGWALPPAIGTAIGVLAVRAYLPGMLGTTWGHLLLAKLALFAGMLACAAHLRWRLLVRAPVAAGERVVALELAQGTLVVLCAAALAETLPATHDLPRWPFAWRVDFSVAWQDRALQPWLLCAAGAALTGSVLWLAGWLRPPPAEAPRLRRQVAAAGLAVAGALATWWSAAVPAWPDTFRRPDVAYDAVSITAGLALYQAHCVGCHGLAGRGDGPLVAAAQRRAADLTQPHTGLHTAGDLFWWLTHGIAGKGMPGFGERLSEEDRWDLINFLRTLSVGHQGRILGPSLVYGGGWLPAPDIAWVTPGGRGWRLRDLRERGAVILAFPGAGRFGPGELSQVAVGLSGVGATLAVVAPPGAGIAPGVQGTVGGAAPSGVVRIPDETGAVRRAYGLLARTLQAPGDEAAGPDVTGFSFLVDRHGYVRARWAPRPGEATADAWRAEAARLVAEPPPAAPADDHVH